MRMQLASGQGQGKRWWMRCRESDCLLKTQGEQGSDGEEGESDGENAGEAMVKIYQDFHFAVLSNGSYKTF